MSVDLSVEELNFRNRLVFRSKFISLGARRLNRETNAKAKDANIICDHCGTQCTDDHWHVQTRCGGVVCTADHVCFPPADVCPTCLTAFQSLNNVFSEETLAISLGTANADQQSLLRFGLQIISWTDPIFLSDTLGACFVCGCESTGCGQFYTEAGVLKSVCRGCANAIRFLQFPVMMPRTYNASLKSVVDTLREKQQSDKIVAAMVPKQVGELMKQQFADRMLADE